MIRIPFLLISLVFLYPLNLTRAIILHYSGTYKRTDSETSLDIGLDINGTKHLDASIGYNRTDGHYGYNYKPKFYLAINNERVAELSGTQILELFF